MSGPAPMTHVPDTISRQAIAPAVGWNVAGLAGTRALGLLRTLVLAWLVAPAELGVFSLALLPVDVLLMVTDFGLSRALAQADTLTDHDARVLWTMGVLRAIVVSAVLLLAAPVAAQLFGEPRVTDAARLLAARPLLAACASIGLAQRQRVLDFRPAALCDIVGAAVQLVVSVLLAPAWHLFALVAGVLLGVAVSTVVSYVVAPHRPRITFDTRVFARFRHMTGWLLATSALGAIGEWVLAYAITHAGGSAAYGRYAFAATLVLVPAAMIGMVMQNVGLVVQARLPDEARVAAVRRGLLVMGVVALPYYALLNGLAPTLAPWLPNAQWSGVATLVALLSAAAILGLWFDAATTLLTSAGQPRRASMITLAFTVVIATLAWPLSSAYGASGAATSRLIAEVAAATAAVFLTHRLAPLRWTTPVRPLLIIVAIGLATTLLLRVMLAAVHSVSLQIGCVVLGGLACAFSALYLERTLHLGVRALLVRPGVAS